MAQFEVTVRLFDLIEPDAATAQRTVEERLRNAGFTRAQVVNVAAQPPVSLGVATPPRPAVRDTQVGRALLVVACVVAAAWFYYLLGG